MKKITLFVIFSLFGFLLSAQQNDASKGTKTKFTEFTSQSGTIMSFEDYNNMTFETWTGSLTAKKRIVKKVNEQKVFLILEIPGNSAAIAEDDLADLFKAVSTLQNDALIDVNSNSEYMEKYYVTKDNFKIGYYVSNKQVKWYVYVDTRLSDSIFLIKNFDSFITKIKTIVS